ncbi:MAG: polysaccharide deacetylase family protein [Verrucomicrobiota bacterium]
MINARATSVALGGNVPVLMYHDLVRSASEVTSIAITQQLFESHLDTLKQAGWTTLPLRDLYERPEKANRRERCVWITFDDGYTSFVEMALPALLARNMTATLFVVAGAIGEYNLWDITQDLPRRALLDYVDLRACLEAGIEIGSHGWAHRDLKVCSADEIYEEIFRSRYELQSQLASEIRGFAYPYGTYSSTFFPKLANAGYAIALSTTSAEPTVLRNPYAVRRIGIRQADTTMRLRFKLSRLYLDFRGWRRR